MDRSIEWQCRHERNRFTTSLFIDLQISYFTTKFIVAPTVGKFYMFVSKKLLIFPSRLSVYARFLVTSRARRRPSRSASTLTQVLLPFVPISIFADSGFNAFGMRDGMAGWWVEVEPGSTLSPIYAE